MERIPEQVPGTAKPPGEVRARWAWAEASVWTDRMLTALEGGVKGGRWHSLIDKVWSERNLRSSWEKVKANKGGAGVDHVTIERYEARLDENLRMLGGAIREDRYRPQAIRRGWAPKPGSSEPRPLGIPTVRDRVVQGAVRHVIEPIFEREFAEHSYGFRPGRGCKDALRRVDGLLKSGYRYVVDADIKSYYDTIPHDRLMRGVAEKVSDGRVLRLVEAYLNQNVLDGMREWRPEKGTPQGAVLSPLLSNIYLNSLDHRMAEKGYKMTRYADDFVILCRSRWEAEEALREVEAWMEEAGLMLHPEKTRIVDMGLGEGFDFLGYHFEGIRRWPSRKSLQKFRDAIRAKTKRTNGHSLADIIAEVNRTLQGWFGYFKHSIPSTFRRQDGWLRMRLRSILRKRKGGRGRGRGRDQQVWPNSYFAERGLFSLQTAYATVCQSSRR